MATETIDEPSPSTSKDIDFNPDAVKALIGKGKRHYVCQETIPALDCFAEACKMLSSRYGQTANECAEAYLFYGKTLLDVARMENGVLGNALKDGPDVEECDDEDLPNQGKEADDKVEQTTIAEKAEESEKNDEDNEEEEIEETNEEEEVEEMNEEEEEEQGNDEDQCGDNVPSMQLAWEMLELAKLIFKRQNSKEAKISQADATMSLGEINLELEHYPEAVGDFSECLRLQESTLDADDRCLAETRYNLGLAFSFDKQFEKAIEQFKKAVEIIEMKIKNTEQKLSEKEVSKEKEESSDESLSSLQKELKELKSLVPDIKAKVEDAEEMKRTNLADFESMKQFAKDALTGTSGFDAPSQEEKEPVKTLDVSLVRKKRKPDEEEESSSVECKKPKKSIEDSTAPVNGHPAQNGCETEAA